ncbi:hypothetical protein [Kitasatospora sp. NPDC004289]
MADEKPQQTDERGHDFGPWWAELGTVGSVALVVVGLAAVVWVTFRLPGTPENLASGYYQAARVVAIGLVAVGCTVLGRRRARAAAEGETGA